ncbi:hypothetical protein Tco_1042631 [Tanacetum coccineum]|uniref:Uncharacterized protein n=1 Tax=Tanacetum coccineum TaxID=301880 RepID=A0ABQ5GJX7_9ASTR
MNFIFDQEERARQLEDYMRVIIEEFMEFSAKVTRRLKENKNKPRKIEKITKYPDTKVLENSAKYDFLENLEKKTFPTPANLLCVRYVRILPPSPSQPRKKYMDQDFAHMVAASKVPMLKLGEFELWRMRIKQYIQMIDYALWEVIENGITLPKTSVVEGVEKLKFNSIKDAKLLLEAVEKRFSGNAATKKTQRNLLKH